MIARPWLTFLRPQGFAWMGFGSKVDHPGRAAEVRPRALLVTLSSASDVNHVIKGRANLKLDNVII